MSVLTVTNLLEEVQNAPRRVDADERRRLVAYCTSMQPEISNTELAHWCKVTEGCIRKDRLLVRKKMAKDVQEDDIALIIGDILGDFKRQISHIEKSKEKATLGTNNYLQHCSSAMDIRLKTVKALQDLGFLPKQLGNMTVQKFEYAAVVTVDGSVDTRPLGLFDENVQKEVRGRVPAQLNAAPVETPQLEKVIEPEYVESFEPTRDEVLYQVPRAEASEQRLLS